MRAMGLKSAAKALMAKAGAPIVPGYHGDNQSPKFLKEKAYEIGYPVLIKAIAGGGGTGHATRRRPCRIRVCARIGRARGQGRVRRSRVLVEKYMLSPRHIEVQVFGDKHGNVVHLFERDCSLQRRHQKVIEESPAPGPARGDERRRCARPRSRRRRRLVIRTPARSSSSSTPRMGWVRQFLVLGNEYAPAGRTSRHRGDDRARSRRMAVAGRGRRDVAAATARDPRSGAAIEARLCAEDPENGFLPSPGLIRALRGRRRARLRVDAGVESGDSVTPFYDSMIAKLIAHGATRGRRSRQLDAALKHARRCRAEKQYRVPHRADDGARGRRRRATTPASSTRISPNSALRPARRSRARDASRRGALAGGARESPPRGPRDPWSVARLL